MPDTKFAFEFCPDCGTRYQVLSWPRHCHSCGHQQWRNPKPVCVMLVPVPEIERSTVKGLLMIRRNIETDPGYGKLALPSGYIGMGETWQQAGAREVREETGWHIAADGIRHLETVSAPDGTVLIFGLAGKAFEMNDPIDNEATDIQIVGSDAWDRDAMAFPLHSAAIIRHYWST